MKSKKVKRVGRVGTRRLMSLLFAVGLCLLTSCSVGQSIKVKQSQGEQIQETEIIHQGKLDNLSLSFINCPASVNPLSQNLK